MSTMRSQDEIRNTVVSLGLPEHPYFMRRTVRAISLLDTGKVNFVGDEIFRVHSQFDDQIYHVELNHGTPGCTCPDHQKNPGVLCKHMIAATIYQKRAKVTQMIIRRRSDGVYGIIDGNHVTQVFRIGDKWRCNCRKPNCKHLKAVINTINPDGNGNGPKPTNECGSEHAKAMQDKMNGQLDSRNDNGNGAHKAPSQPMQLDINDPFQESEFYDIEQIEGRLNGELVHKLSNGEYVISYAGVMKLAEKHHITFDEAIHDDTSTVIAKGRCGTSERVSGKPMNGNANTAMELAKRNAARQLLPLPEIKAVEKKAQLESEFDWQKAYDKCVKLVGGKAQLDCIIYDLVKDGKLRQDNPSHYDRTEWLIIHDACKKDADDNSCEERSNHGDPSERTPELPNNADDFVSKCKVADLPSTRQEAIAKVRDEKKSIEANDQPLQNDNGDKRKLMMDKKLKTWLIETDGTKKEISCREICEQFESKLNPSIVTRLRAGIDDGADISIVELDN